jgi:hypothetical protein
LEIVKAGDHCERKISKQMLPLLLIFGWYILVWKLTWEEGKNEGKFHEMAGRKRSLLSVV